MNNAFKILILLLIFLDLHIIYINDKKRIQRIKSELIASLIKEKLNLLKNLIKFNLTYLIDDGYDINIVPTSTEKALIKIIKSDSVYFNNVYFNYENIKYDIMPFCYLLLANNIEIEPSLIKDSIGYKSITKFDILTDNINDKNIYEIVLIIKLKI